MEDQGASFDLAQIRAEQNFNRAIPVAIVAAIFGAILWAVFGYVTGMSLGLIAIAIGALVGYAVRRVGKGVDPKFGYLGGAASAFGWALGSWMCDVALLAKETDQPVLEVFARLGLADSIAFTFRASGAMDLLFLGIAIYEGYRFSFRYKQVR